MRPRALRVAAWTAGSIVFFFVALVVGTNILLKTAWLRGEIGSRPESMAMDWRGARSTLPGRVCVDVLTLRVRDSNMELQAVLEGVEVRISLPDLLRHRFHATRVRADRLAFHLRERLEKAEATPARLARYPEIEGWPEPPLIGVPANPPQQKDPWRIVVDDLSVARAEEIWINSYRWTGSARVEGAFDLLPSRRARVGPARLEVADGAVRRGGATVAARTVGAVWCELSSFDTQAYPGNDVWKIMSGGVTLRGKFGGPAFLTADEGSPRLSGGDGGVHARVALKDGAGKVFVGLMAHDAKVETAARTIRGTVGIDVRATRVDFKKGEASLGGTSMVLSDVSVNDGGKIAAWAATFLVRAGRLGFDDGSLSARVEGRIRDARPIVALMPPGLPKWAAGLLRLKDLDVRGHIALAPSRLAVEGLEVSSGDFSLDGYYRRTGGVAEGNLHVKKGILSVRVPL